MKSKFTHLVVTGATGFVGTHFLHWLLQMEPSVHVDLILRGNTIEAARARLHRLLTDVASSYGLPFQSEDVLRRCSIVLGDITQPLCGLKATDIQALRQRKETAFWHVAASLNFEDTHKELIEQHNVGGTTAALDLATALQCDHFFYVSTAYTCGLATGEIEERMHDPKGPFGNAYERSKCAAEHLVAQRCSGAAIGYNIVRPSIVVGLSGSGEPAGAETGLYGLARELLRAKRKLLKHPDVIRLVGDAAAQVNLVPVDFVAQQMVRLSSGERCDSTIVQLCAAGGPSAQQTVDAVTEAVGVRNFTFVPELPEDASPIEHLLSKRLVFYRTYLNNDKRFVAREKSAPALDKPQVRRMVDLSLLDRSRDRSAMVKRRLVSRDGAKLTAARNELAPNPRQETVVVVNALGMPNAALDRLTASLSKEYDVITWESRGASSFEGDLNQSSTRFAAHTDDLEDLLLAYGVTRAHLIGWCTGADVCLDFLSRHQEKVLSLTCLNGGFVKISDARTPFQGHLEQIARRVSKSGTHARMFHALMTSSDAAQASGPAPDAGLSILQTISAVDPCLAHITGAPLQTPELLQRYFMLLEHYFDEAPAAIPCSHVPTFFGTAKDDDITPCEASIEISRRFANSELHFVTNGGHFAPCTSDALILEVAGFLARSRDAVNGTVARAG
jgi:thioester reductase-like protein/pimeloyl-ACP methyl ester carboxylesterase